MLQLRPDTAKKNKQNVRFWLWNFRNWHYPFPPSLFPVFLLPTWNEEGTWSSLRYSSRTTYFKRKKGKCFYWTAPPHRHLLPNSPAPLPLPHLALTIVVAGTSPRLLCSMNWAFCGANTKSGFRLDVQPPAGDRSSHESLKFTPEFTGSQVHSRIWPYRESSQFLPEDVL